MLCGRSTAGGKCVALCFFTSETHMRMAQGLQNGQDVLACSPVTAIHTLRASVCAFLQSQG